jgi:SAM-dependent methyltransferase
VGIGNGRRPRWQLTDDERVRSQAAQVGWSLPGALRTLAGAPRLLPEAIRLTLGSVRQAVWSDVELAVLLDSERVRQVLPDAVRGAHWYPDESFVAALLPRLDRDMRVLELGCGVGRVSRQVAPHVGELTCTDVSRIMLDEARENLSALDNVRFSRTHGFRLEGFEDAGFDLVFAHAVFFFFELYPALSLLDELCRVLRPGGTCVLSFLTIDRPAWAREALGEARRAAARGTFSARQFRPYASGQIEAMYAAVGLRVVDCGFGELGDADGRAPLIVVGEAPQVRP